MNELERHSGKKTYCFTGRDLQHLGGESNGALDTELLVLGPVNKVGGD